MVMRESQNCHALDPSSATGFCVGGIPWGVGRDQGGAVALEENRSFVVASEVGGGQQVMLKAAGKIYSEPFEQCDRLHLLFHRAAVLPEKTVEHLVCTH